MKAKKNSVKVYRTVEATVFELLTAILILIMWCVVGWIWNKTPDVIPVHFNVYGEPDSYGEKWFLLVLGGIGTLCTLLMMVSAYFPSKMVNIPIEVRSHRQYELVVRMCRVIGVLMSLMFISIIVSIYNGGSDGVFYVLLPVCMILVVIVYYIIRIYRVR